MKLQTLQSCMWYNHLAHQRFQRQTSSQQAKKDNIIEDSLRDSLKMLYENAPPNAVKRSMLYVVGGSNIPVGVLNSITNLTSGILGESNSQIDMTSESEESKVVMLSSIQGMTKFDNYDPLGIIPQEDTLDRTTTDSSIYFDLNLKKF